jgi:hypothetical protein
VTDQLDPEGFEAWPDHLKLEAVKVYGHTKDWRALARLYPGLPVKLVKEWQAAGVLVDKEPFSVPSSATEEPELSEEEQEAIHRSLQAQQR